MKWKYLLIPFFLFFSVESYSTHIVGGEIELVHDSGYYYTASLIMYFDSVNGNAGARDNFLRVAIYRKFDNVLIDTVFLPQISITKVPYSFPDCSIPELVTERITYSAQLELDPNIYNDINGYYMSWDRCCRNNNITNLWNPGGQGQAFYLEFPPSSINGTQFINSSPILFPPVSDYACLDELFYFDFSGTDPDGDSLVYSMVNPLRGNSTANNPSPFIPFPGPYPTVIWQTGFNLFNQIPGTPALSISPTGFLTVKPNLLGLFVFSVKCEEYRAGVKIGEIRRDFQIIVIDCPDNDKPAISVQDPVSGTNFPKDDTLYIDLNNRCFDIFLKDPDPNTSFFVEINALNFDPNFITVTPKDGVLPSGGDSLRATVCFNKCAYSENEPYQFEIILADDGCSLPKKDTFLITAIVDAIPDQAPQINSNFIGDSIILEVGDTLIMNINGFDSDNDTIILSYGPNNFNPLEYGMQFSQTTGSGSITNQFYWVPDCNALDLNGEKLIFRVYDYFCSNYDDTLAFPLKIITDNKKPQIKTDLFVNEVNINTREAFSFGINAMDSNFRDVLLIRPKVYDTGGVEIQDINYTLAPRSSRNILNSTFILEPDCNLILQDELLFEFEVIDNGCLRMRDTVYVKADLDYQNTKPSLDFINESDGGRKSRTIKLFTDSTVVLSFEGMDADNDFIRTRWEWSDTSEGKMPIAFASTENFGNNESELVIGPASCSELDILNSSLNLIIQEESCLNESDTFEVNIEVEEFFREVKVPNVFTPNGDGYNDYFYPEQLPKRCEFADITIYNRWGLEVFKSENSDFKWSADDVPAGDYFYQIRFDGTSYKGIIKVLK